ncbi:MULTISPECIES: acetylxylan esterase [unclassified Streptomyces]|uniref:acetylxylan esterase n=1 Tax=unclassified Streptomyces TaxID=2593676 RepID=UPI0004CA13AB|nr:acetylxylan esterase [Streptomyces sp. NRRL F-5630]
MVHADDTPPQGPGAASPGTGEGPYGFDPTYGYELPALLAVPAPPAPDDFGAFWGRLRERARAVVTEPELGPVEDERDGLVIRSVTYTSLGGVRLGGWCALPTEGPVRHGFVIGHGYGGRDRPGPDLPLPLGQSAAILPCLRGLPARGLVEGVPAEADAHVLHGIASRETSVLGECVADLWCAASALVDLVPALAGPRLGYLGESLGGGLGALALPWDERFVAAQLTVPTFGNHPLRLTLPSVGSGESVRRYHAEHPEVTDVLAYFDAATAATLIRVPTLVAAALYDPAVPPPGQFAVHNALPAAGEPFLLRAGHHPHAEEATDRTALAQARTDFFAAHMPG